MYKLRSQVAARIKALADTLQVAPLGNMPVVEKVINELDAIVEDANYKAALIDNMKMNADKRYFAIGFKNGDVLGVYPRKDDPLRFETKISATSPGRPDSQTICFMGDEPGAAVFRGGSG